MNKENHINVNKHFATEEIDLLKFKNKTSDEQINIIKDILSSAYPSTEILNSWILSCIELANQNNNDYIKLPKKLIVQKKSNKLIFKFENKKNEFSTSGRYRMYGTYYRPDHRTVGEFF